MSKRFFINNIDSLVGSAILKELTKGADDENNEIEPIHMATYGLDHERSDRPRGVKRILKRSKPKLSKEKMLKECDVYIYDTH